METKTISQKVNLNEDVEQKGNSEIRTFELRNKCYVKTCTRKQYEYIKSFSNVHFITDRGKSSISAMMSKCSMNLASEIIELAKSGEQIEIKYW